LLFRIAWASALVITPAAVSGAAQKRARSKTPATAKKSTEKKAAPKTAGKAHGKPAHHTAGKGAARRADKVVAPPKSRFPEAAPGSLQALVHAYRDKASAAGESAITRYARAHAGKQAGGLAFLALATAEVEHSDFGSVVEHAQAARKSVPELADYAAYLEASAYAARRETDSVERSLEPLWTSKPESPMAANAMVLEMRALIGAGQAEKALALLTKYRDEIPAPRAALVEGQALEAAGRKADAARSYQTVFYDYPMAGEAGAAEKALSSLCATSPCPVVAGERIVDRGRLLLKGGEESQALTWIRSQAAKLEGPDLDAARVLEGASRAGLKQDAAAFAYFQSLRVASPEADAERLYYIVRLAERLDRSSDSLAALREMATKYKASPWRERALILAGNRRFVDNNPTEYLPMFQACYEDFPDSADAAYCHWRVVWMGYLRDRNGSEAALKTHLKNYPKSTKANAALYYLGRIAESRKDLSQAKLWYAAAAERYPNSYYAFLSRDRLRQSVLLKAAGAPEVQAFLKTIPKPVWPALDGFEPSPDSHRRINRSRLLSSAGLEDYAERELRFAAENGEQPQVMAMELARLSNQGDSPDQAIRYIKRYVPNYLTLPLDAAPEKFWRLAFPMPYRNILEKHCSEYSLDPYFVAALIRQESEFNTRAVSYAKALGLSQVMPSTGRELSRRLKIHPYHTSSLFDPDVNLKIGTYYLRHLLDRLDGSVEATLASYNAGKSRVDRWKTWADYKEPAEFVESIPFLQTRDYVQVVLHNADIYRRLYNAPEPLTASKDALP
jgi:soluble lytic murein transglycosylase